MSDETKSLTPQDSSPEERLERVLAEYLRQVEQGAEVDQQAILAANPDLADDLREFFANQARMQRLIGPSLSPAPHNGVAPAKLRYFGDYEILEEIAHGGMGVVYKARQTTLNRIVAVKMILAGQLANESDVQRFQAEAEAAANLHHPGVVGIYEVGVQDGQHYYSMEYIHGQNLSQIIREKPLPIATAAEYVRDIATVLEYAHQQKVLHRDLKPSNILRDGSGRLRITDFGLAKRVEGGSDLTMTGQVLGTPSYMSPEQAAAQHAIIGPPTDIYALGAILYELVTGRPPFRSENVGEILRQVQQDEPVRPRLLNPKLPRDLETICLKCLEKEPHRRYGTAQLLADDLGRFLRGEPIVARPTTPWERGVKWVRRRPTAAALALASVTAMLALVGVVVGQHYNARLETVIGLLNITKENLEESNNQLTTSNDLLNVAKADLEASNLQLKGTNSQLADASTKLEFALKDAQAERARARRYLYVSQMTLAERARQEGKIGRVVQLLRSVIPESADQEDLRGFEWHHLWRLYHGEQSRLRGHTGAVTSVAFSPDDRLLATASADKTVKLWDAVTGKELRSLKGHTTRVTGIAFSPDGSRLVSGGSDTKIMLWDTATGQRLRDFVGHQGPVTSVAFSPDGTRLVSGSADKTIRIWDANTSQMTLEFKGHASQVSGVAFSPDGTRVGSVAQDGLVTAQRGEAFVWNPETGQIFFRLAGENEPGKNGMPWTCVAFSPDGSTLAAGGIITRPSNVMEITIQSWDLATGKAIKSLKGHDNAILQLAYSPDGKRLVSSSADQTVKVWDIGSDKETFSFQEEAACLSSVFSHDGRRFASGSEDRTVKLWTLPAQEARTVFEGKGRINNVAFSPDGSRVAAESANTVYVWDVENGDELIQWANPSFLGRLAWSPDGQHIAIGRAVWKTATGKRTDPGVKELLLERMSGMGTAFSPDGKLLAAVANMGTVDVWDVNTGNRVHVLHPALAPSCWPCCVAFSTNGRHLAIGSGTDRFPLPGTLEIWDVTTGQPSQTLEGFRDAVVAVAFSPDGKHLAAGVGDPRGFGQANPGEVRVWDTATWQEVHNLRGHLNCVYGVAFSPDGKRLASAAGRLKSGKQGEVKIWDFVTGQEVAALHVSQRAVVGVAFSPCGRYLATSSDDGMVKIFDGTPIAGVEIGSLKERLTNVSNVDNSSPPPKSDVPQSPRAARSAVP